MIIVNAVRKHQKNENWRYVDVNDDGKVVSAFCGGRQADELKIGEALPPDWKIEPGQYGPVLRYPQPAGGGGKGGGFAAAWRNTEPGFRYEQSRMDRRTALMQAVQASGAAAPETAILGVAEKMYEWLRKEQ
jgi:hypothetical protein